MATVSFAIAVQLTVGVWTDITADVVARPDSPVQAARGITSNGATDRVAQSGTLEFALRNDAHNSGMTRGWYSPNHASVRAGWTFGIPVRLQATYSAVTYTLWRGKLYEIKPDAGLYQTQLVHCVATDCMNDIASADAREVAAQVNQTEVQLLTTLLASLPAQSQPVATAFDAALDVYPYAFDTIGPGTPALGLIQDIAMSGLGYVYPKGDGTLRYENRHARALASSSFTVSDGTVMDVSVPTSLSKVWNRVRLTYHQKTIDAAATTVLFSATSIPLLAPGQVLTLWGSYVVQSNTLKLIGGTSQVVPIVATTDYLANAAQDGSGTDLTANVSVSTSAFASTVKFTITNNGTTPAYVTQLQVRGKGIYDNAPATAESYATQAYADRPLDVDLPYQNDGGVAQDLADYLRAQYQLLINQVDEVTIYGHCSPTLMVQALAREIGDLVTVSETMTGLASTVVAIQGITYVCASGQFLAVHWRTAPVAPVKNWILDDPVYSILGTTTYLGYA